jgi:hypothetical protein
LVLLIGSIAKRLELLIPAAACGRKQPLEIH